MSDLATRKKSDSCATDANSGASSRIGQSTCHVLPCNVDFQGMAKTHLFFRPSQVADGVLASSFRGRGLLAVNEEKSDDPTQKTYPVLLSLDQNQIQVKVPISNFVEWNHEHNTDSIKYKRKESNRVVVAREWIEISKSVSIAPDEIETGGMFEARQSDLIKNDLILNLS